MPSGEKKTAPVKSFWGITQIVATPMAAFSFYFFMTVHNFRIRSPARDPVHDLALTFWTVGVVAFVIATLIGRTWLRILVLVPIWFVVFVALIPTQLAEAVLAVGCRTQCRRDVPEACYTLATFHRVGRGVRKDLKRAAQLDHQACQKSHYLSCCRLLRTKDSRFRTPTCRRVKANCAKDNHPFWCNVVKEYRQFCGEPPLKPPGDKPRNEPQVSPGM